MTFLQLEFTGKLVLDQDNIGWSRATMIVTEVFIITDTFVILTRSKHSV